MPIEVQNAKEILFFFCILCFYSYLCKLWNDNYSKHI